MAKFLGMQHIALKVRDAGRSAAFYERAFAMRRFGPPKRGGTVIPLVTPDFSAQITLSSEPASGETGSVLGNPGEQGGIDHFGFTISPGANLDDVRARLIACGASYLCRSDIHPRVPSLFFKDPDGYVFQVTRFPRFTRLYVRLLPLIARFKGLTA
ncbi:MAG TPA: VOC family protein [Blastocatellia bacterium]